MLYESFGSQGKNDLALMQYTCWLSVYMNDSKFWLVGFSCLLLVDLELILTVNLPTWVFGCGPYNGL